MKFILNIFLFFNLYIYSWITSYATDQVREEDQQNVFKRRDALSPENDFKVKENPFIPSATDQVGKEDQQNIFKRRDALSPEDDFKVKESLFISTVIEKRKK